MDSLTDNSEFTAPFLSVGVTFSTLDFSDKVNLERDDDGKFNDEMIGKLGAFLVNTSFECAPTSEFTYVIELLPPAAIAVVVLCSGAGPQRVLPAAIVACC